MENKNYKAPEMEIIDVKIENGFATTGGSGGGYAPDSDDSEFG